MSGNEFDTEIATSLREAERLLAAKSFREAHTLCMSVLARDAQNADAYFLLGVLAAEHGNHRKAAELLERAIAHDANSARSHAHLARSFIAMSRFSEALSAAGRAAALNPSDALTLDTIGVVYSRAGRHESAIPYFRKAVSRDASNASYFYNLGASLQFIGEFADSKRAYERAVALDPTLYKAVSALVQLEKQTPVSNHVQELEALFAASGDDADRRLHIGHALAKSYEDIGDYVQSFAWLVKAKQRKKDVIGYRRETDRRVFEAARRTLDGVRRPAHDSDEPIFVIGLPRTGTTLVDRILSSHSGVKSAGESTNFALLLKRMTKTPSNLVLDETTLARAADVDLAQLGADYVAATKPHGTAQKFIDKMPLNFFYAGLIHQALPQARIICLRRGPMDSCLSNYRQLFATSYPYYNYNFDLGDTANYYALFHELMAHWRTVLPADRFIEVHYEAIIDDIESETRRLLAFCGLEWDANCLAFHRNAAPVATASSIQVRQPLYRSSVGRWKRYGEALDPLKRMLGEAIGEADSTGP